MKGHKGYHHTHGTEKRIEEHIRKHRAEGGKAESPKRGDNDAEKDLKDKPEEYDKGKPEREAEETKAKRGGKMESKKCGMKAGGKSSIKHAGRKHRASGGGCESNPFTSANKGTGPRERKTERETEGRDD